ncbi:MAG: FAD-dependent oxidoreductase [Bacteroidales bacterium]|nr:FAD-dependent oxidoreductase [Bacteroidales bacterium]
MKNLAYVTVACIIVFAAILGREYYLEKQQSELCYVPGTYTVTADGFHGPVTLEVTFDSYSITDIRLVCENETEEIGSLAIPMMTDNIMKAQGAGVDAVSGATVTCDAVRTAVCRAAEMAKVSNMVAFRSKRRNFRRQDDIDDTWDIVVIGGGGAGLAAAAQAAQEGNTVLVIEKNASLGGNTIISGGAYQSLIPYLVWEENNPDATSGKAVDGETYPKIKCEEGCLDVLRTILNWSEKPFDKDYYLTHEFVAGDIKELSRHGVHREYLSVLRELKGEIRKYLAWADKRMAGGIRENQLTLFSTLNLHVFQTYYGGLRPSSDGREWCYGNEKLVSQFVREGQQLRPWLTNMGVHFVETQGIIVGALWYRSVIMTGATITLNGKQEEVAGKQGVYVMAPYATMINANKHNRVLTMTSAEELMTENGRVVGVHATCSDGAKVTAHARKGVIIATGGYAANLKKVMETNKYWSAECLTSSMKTDNRSSLQGDGIDMAQAVGADVTGMGWTQLMPLAFANDGSIAFGNVAGAIMIAPKTGKRFVDEMSERDVISLSAFRNGIKMMGANGFHIYITNTKSNDATIGPPIADHENAQYTITIAQLPEILKRQGVKTDPQAIINTIRDFDNAAMEGRQPEGVGRLLTSKLIGEVKKNADGSYDRSSYNLESAQLCVRFLAPSTHHTMGGLCVDLDRRVLDTNGKPIKGLYAAGEVTGGIHGGNRLGGNAITEILVSGRIAARSAGAMK